MNFADNFRAGQRKQVIVAAQITFPCGEARSPIFRFGEAKALNHGSHCAIEHEDALRKRTQQCACTCGPVRAGRVKGRRMVHGNDGSLFDVCNYAGDSFWRTPIFERAPKQKNLSAKSQWQTGFSTYKKSLFRFSRISGSYEPRARKVKQIGANRILRLFRHFWRS